jgi:ADP-ribose pyrophosphatase
MGELIYEGHKINLHREDIELPGGTPYKLDVFHHPGASAIVPLHDDGRVTLLHQYRWAAGGFIWEVPAGTLDGGEDPAVCARRELQEETGLHAERWTKVGRIFTVPSFCTEIIHLYVAEGLSQAETAHEEDEVIDEIRAVPLQEALAMIDHGDIVDAKSIAALFHTDRLLRSRQEG